MSPPPRRRNVLHLIDTDGPGGAETVFIEVATGLDPERWNSFASIPGPGWVSRNLTARGIDPVVLPTRGRFDVRLLVGLLSRVRRLEIDLIQTHLFGSALYGGLAGLLCRVPVVSTLHGVPDLPSGPRSPRLRYLVLRLGVRRIVLVSKALRNAFHERGSFPLCRTSVIHNGIDLKRFRPGSEPDLRRSFGCERGDVLVGAVGNIRPAKAYDDFLHAAALLAARNPRVRFVIAGEQDDTIFPRLLDLRTRLGLEDRFRFLGFRDDVERIIRAFDVFVSTSSTEGFSLTTVQAMASGVPVVATRSGGPEEIATDGVDALLVDPGSPPDLSEAVDRLIRDSGLATALSRRALRRARTAFSVERMVGDYAAVYREILDGTHR